MTYSNTINLLLIKIKNELLAPMSFWFSTPFKIEGVPKQDDPDFPKIGLQSYSDKNGFLEIITYDILLDPKFNVEKTLQKNHGPKMNSKQAIL